MDINIKTFADLKDYIDRLSLEQLQQPVTIVIDDSPVCYVRGAEILPEDLLENIEDFDDCGTETILKEVHGDQFARENYVVSFPAGTTFLTIGMNSPLEEETPDRKCRVCGCTDSNCSQCIRKTGSACHWVEEDLCSACIPGSSLLLPGRDF